jgi:hypothetical protein
MLRYSITVHSWRPFLHPQPEDAPCGGDRDPPITGNSYKGNKSTGQWMRPLTSICCRGYELVELCIHCPYIITQHLMKYWLEFTSTRVRSFGCTISRTISLPGEKLFIQDLDTIVAILRCKACPRTNKRSHTSYSPGPSVPAETGTTF